VPFHTGCICGRLSEMQIPPPRCRMTPDKKTAEPKPCRCLFSREAFNRYNAKLFGGHFFLFAFHAHLFEFALFGFDGCGDFLLDLGCRFFELG
jgi:hypothetical protein